MRKTVTVTALSLLMLGGFTSAAHATEAAAPVGTLACSGTTVTAKETVKIRSKATTSSTAIGQLNKGKKACETSSPTGGYHSACGGKSNVWSKIKVGGKTGYVPWNCMR
ncbi:SH3 domain-containing protein [Prauserella cavernicola]|uniref:SH3 domain-containing protein n=1 Tax=Prauserella cavernicola TaxID=2800127 RepID=A0A934QT45_9PSEU|nr:SH3 domain-containing protein [Prauserella cavernicola]MBK1784874.1 SH3 domain-containing protein [Prauserella cavernicola]